MKSPGLEQRETWATQTGQIGPEGCDSWNPLIRTPRMSGAPGIRKLK